MSEKQILRCAQNDSDAGQEKQILPPHFARRQNGRRSNAPDRAPVIVLRCIATVVSAAAAWGIYELVGLLPHWSQFGVRAAYEVGALTFFAAIVIIAIWSDSE